MAVAAHDALDRGRVNVKPAHVLGNAIGAGPRVEQESPPNRPVPGRSRARALRHAAQPRRAGLGLRRCTRTHRRRTGSQRDLERPADTFRPELGHRSALAASDPIIYQAVTATARPGEPLSSLLTQQPVAGPILTGLTS